MTASADSREWRYLRVALVVVALLVVAMLAGWKIDDAIHPPTPRLELTIECLEQRGVVPIMPTGDPIAESAGGGALKATIEGNTVTVSVASSQDEAAKIESYYRRVAGDLGSRLERRDRTVYLWAFPSSPTQRQATYDCQY